MQTAEDKIKGFLTVQFGDTLLPIKFGINAMCLLTDLLGNNYANASHVTFLRAVTWAGLVCGGEYKNQPFNKDIFQVGDMLDNVTNEVKEQIIQAFIDSQAIDDSKNIDDENLKKK